LAIGERLSTNLAAQRGFSIEKSLGLGYSPKMGAYTYEVRSSRDVFGRSPKGGGTQIIFDGDDGALVALQLPTGERTGNTIESWLYASHMTRINQCSRTLPRMFSRSLGRTKLINHGKGDYLPLLSPHRPASRMHPATGHCSR
jgi:hypothetical protein